MNAFLLRRRQSDSFAQLLDERHGAPRHHVQASQDSDLEHLLALTGALEKAGGQEAGPAPDFKRDLHAMLMATIEREGIGATAEAPAEPEPVQRSQRGRRIRIAAVAGLAAGALAVSSMGMASGDANPGDPLYGMKRSTERAQLALAGTDMSRGQLFLQFAKTRLAEALAVAGDPEALGSVLNDMDSETKQGVRLMTSSALDRRDPAALDAVESFTAEQSKGVSDLLNKVKGDKGRAVGSLGLLSEVQQRSSGLRPVLGCANLGSSVLDDLGPIPQKCAAGNPAGGTQPGGKNTPAKKNGTGTGAVQQPAGTNGQPVVPSAAPQVNGVLPPSAAGQASQPASKAPAAQASSPAPGASQAPDDGLFGTVGKILGGIFG
ncbi:DUF5667 domain-containing protein [Longispora albida]|uniref:DUF5667 domain-containing protein n=1 Tax=Longispora albida TaxID=203523 RepID=UPI000476FD59|nr:DUF5667 domain-containing protein [Longispora albida]